MAKRRRELIKGQATGLEHIAAVGVVCTLLLLLPVHFLSAKPVQAQVQNGIFEPESGASIAGVVSIRGTATHESFLRYELAFSNGADWLVFAEGDRPVVNGMLAIWDTTVGQPANPVFPDGVYQLRLRVVRQDYNYDEYFVRNLMLSNAMTPTPSPTATTEGQPTQPPGTPGPEVTATSGFFIIGPTPLPSLTPFPTPSLPAPPRSDDGAVNSDAEVGADRNVGAAGGGEGVLQRLRAIDSGQFSRAFWMGARVALYAFGLVALYLLLRTAARYLWQRVWRYWSQRE